MTLQRPQYKKSNMSLVLNRFTLPKAKDPNDAYSIQRQNTAKVWGKVKFLKVFLRGGEFFCTRLSVSSRFLMVLLVLVVLFLFFL